MRKRLFFWAAMAVAAVGSLTSCEDILGHWERPTAAVPTPSDGGGNDPTPTPTPAPETGPLATPLTFEAKDAAAQVKLAKNGSIDVSQIYYKLNDGAWLPYTIGDAITLANAGDKVSFWSANEQMAQSDYDYVNFSISDGECYVYGNVMSLIDDADGATKESPKFSEDTELGGTGYTLCSLFKSCNKLFSHPEKKFMLPATDLRVFCYSKMFSDCTKLETAPELPATELVNNCYDQMFYNCTSLTATPMLPATELQSECYQKMFSGCTALQTAWVKAGYDDYKCQDMFADVPSGGTLHTTETAYSSWNGAGTAKGGLTVDKHWAD